MTDRPWTQPIGFKYALSEVVADVVKRADDLEDPEAIVAAITGTDLDTMVGTVNWANGPINKVIKTPLVAGQWQNGELQAVANSNAPDIPITVNLKLLT